MRVAYYQRLSDPEGGARAAARAWAALRLAAARTASLYAGLQRRRRWTARRLLWCGRRVALAQARARGYEYDPASYERNFDDGEWRDEEGVSWHARRPSFAASRLAAAAVQ